MNPEQRWSGAFRTCTACDKRNFAGRSRCTACGAALRRPSPPPAYSPRSLIGLRGTDRFQGRGVVVAGWAVALFTLAGGVFVHRALRDVDWTLLAGAATTADIRVPPLPIWEMAAPPLPAFPRAEDRALYEKGRRLLAAGDAKAAVGPLAEAARRLPRDPVVMHDYGLALVHTGRQDLGLFKLEHASRMVPGIGSYRLDLIRALLAAGRRAHAVRELEGLLARDPTNLAAAELRASLPPGMDPEGGVASPGTAAGSMDLGGAAGDGGGESPRPVEGGAAFTNEDLGRRRTVIASPSPPA